MAAPSETVSRFGSPPDHVDPYLLLAEAIGFADHFAAHPERDNEMAHPVSIELTEPGAQLKIAGLTLRPAHVASRFVTGTATASALKALAQDGRVVRAEWAQPLLLQRAATPPLQNWAREIAPSAEPSAKTGAEAARVDQVLLAVIDNGCPFAHLDLRRERGDGGIGTRVVRLWDQNPLAAGDTVGTAPAGFDYGCEVTQDQMDTLMQAATSASGVVDEERCYRMAGYEAVLHRHSHGAHALGMLASARRWAGHPQAPGPLLPMPIPDVGANADIAFVQLPQQLMNCVSVANMEHHAIDAFRYLQRIGMEGKYERVVVSFGYESWVGPHDGSTWFESALSSLVNESEAIDMQVYLIAGNAKNERAHVQADSTSRDESLYLQLPPDQEIPTFVEIWAPSATKDLQIRIDAPNGQTAAELTRSKTVAWPTPDRAQLAATMHQRVAETGSSLSCALLRWSPTRSSGLGSATAAHGVWSIHLSSASSTLAGVNAYVGRARADMNAPRRGMQPRFVRRTAEQMLVDQQGTLNGHACASSPNIVVVGAYGGTDFPYREGPTTSHALREHSADYSASGPTNGARARPDVSVPVDDGVFVAGTLAMGTRSACVFRMSGTSVAAPLLARGAADKSFTPQFSKARGAASTDDSAMGDPMGRQ